MNNQTQQMPDELRQMIEAEKINRQERVEKLGKQVAKLRDEAVTGRKASGIETVWQEDEEYYLGIDDANRLTQSRLKSPGVQGGITTSAQPGVSGRCSSFFNITAQFVDSASARLGDILLPAGDWNFAIKATPIPDPAQVVNQGYGMVGQRVPPPPDGQPGMQSLPVMDQIQASAVDQADKMVEKAELRIRDWLTECHYHTECRRVIEECCKIGSGVIKGPVPAKENSLMLRTNEAGAKTLVYDAKITPASKFISCWDFFPDPACGDNIHDGNYCIERDSLTSKRLRELKGLPGYLDDQIDKVLDEGPGKRNYSDGMRVGDVLGSDDDQYEVWYFYGNIDMDSLDAMGIDSVTHDSCPAIVTLVNDTAIKATLSPLDVGGFPFDIIPYQQIPASPWGYGIARKGRTAQDLLNAAARQMVDNGGLSCAPLIIVRDKIIRPADGNWSLRGGKVFIATEQADVRTVGDAIMSINIPSVHADLAAKIQMAQKMMEDSTGMAYLMQGQQGSAPDTVGGMELLNRNASAILRRYARTFDERLTEPHIRRYYAWLMEYGQDDEKGDLQIEAVGSSALVEREIQAIETAQLLQASSNPIYGLDPAKTMEELLKLKRLSPGKFQLTDAQKAQAQQQVSPAVQVAQIRAQTDTQVRRSRIRQNSPRFRRLPRLDNRRLRLRWIAAQHIPRV